MPLPTWKFINSLEAEAKVSLAIRPRISDLSQSTYNIGRYFWDSNSHLEHRITKKTTNFGAELGMILFFVIYNHSQSFYQTMIYDYSQS